jgi:peptidoglycan/xylan/chitin deacetylase (PgdA/CDA1 family)
MALDLISRFTAANRISIMLYHGFCKGSTRDARFPKLLPIQQFEEHLRIFARYGRPCSIEELAAGADRGIVITFDDGYANNYDLAFPLLRKYRFPAAIFVTSGFLDRTTPLWGDWLEFLVTAAPRSDTAFYWEGNVIPLRFQQDAPAAIIAELKALLRAAPPASIHAFLRGLQEHLRVSYSWAAVPEQLRPLRWEDVRAMRQSGLVSFGAHTVSHPVLSRCSPADQASEINTSKRRLEEELGESCLFFAYPYGKPGDYTGVTKQIVKQAGYVLALGAANGTNRPSSWDPYDLRRWGADLSTDELSFLVAGGPKVIGSLKRAWYRREPVEGG